MLFIFNNISDLGNLVKTIPCFIVSEAYFSEWASGNSRWGCENFGAMSARQRRKMKGENVRSRAGWIMNVKVSRVE